MNIYKAHNKKTLVYYSPIVKFVNVKDIESTMCMNECDTFLLAYLLLPYFADIHQSEKMMSLCCRYKLRSIGTHPLNVLVTKLE